MDGSDMSMYILYIILVIIMAVIGWYIGKTQDVGTENKKAMMGAGLGGLLGLAVAYGVHSYNSPNAGMAYNY